MAMIEQIKDFIEGIKANPRIVIFDEAATKQFVVLPILQGLGWNTQSVNEVRPEFPIENRKVDFSLHVNDSLIFIEVKRIGEDLERHEKQLLEYSFLRGIEFAILTNGTLWWFYLPMKRGDWQTRKFATLDLSQQDSLHVAQKFVDLLSKENAGTLENAEEVYRSKSIADTLPAAWNKLITQPDLTLIERLSETTKQICGYSPETDEIKHFLKEYSDRIIIHLEEKKHRTTRNKSEALHRTTPVIVAHSIAKLLDAIAAEYLKQPKHLLSNVDNVTVYSHPDYLLRFTARRSPSLDNQLNQSQFDQLEFLATSRQIVNAFERYCALHGLENPYTTASIFAAKLRQEKEQLSKAHWEIVSRNSIKPYFKEVQGKRYWKFVKTG
jgi:hypothetical protein